MTVELNRKAKGDMAELAVATDLCRRHLIAIPFGEDWDSDLIVRRKGTDQLERVQVKHAQTDGAVISVKCFSHSLTNGKVRATKLYTAAMIDWLAAYDRIRDGATTFRQAFLATGAA
ncbi:MAG: endonuclease [Thermoleophilaceae bacterium]|jgi:hypothetical protein|nr:endonuclease [Thermoleophilaceae bacterium]